MAKIRCANISYTKKGTRKFPDLQYHTSLASYYHIIEHFLKLDGASTGGAQPQPRHPIQETGQHHDKKGVNSDDEDDVIEKDRPPVTKRQDSQAPQGPSLRGKL